MFGSLRFFTFRFLFLCGLSLVNFSAYSATIYTYPSGGTSCMAGAKAGISAALAAAAYGDTIAACAGTYNEAVQVTKGGLTITSVSGNRDVTINAPSGYVGINANTNLNPTGALKLRHLNIISDSYGVSIQFTGSGTGGHEFADLNIDTSSGSSGGIIISSDSRNCSVLFDGLTIKTNKIGIDASNMSCGTGTSATVVPFSNININSGGSGIIIGANSTGAHTFDNVTVNATGPSAYGIYASRSGGRYDGISISSTDSSILIDQINSRAPVFARLNLTAGSGSGIRIASGTAGGDITIGSSAARSVINSNGSYDGEDNSAIFVGALIPAANKLSVSNSDINLPNATGRGYGINSRQSSSSGVHAFSDLNINLNKSSTSTVGIKLEGGAPVVNNVSIGTGGTGFYVVTPSNSGTISFKKASIDSANGRGIWVHNGGSGVSNLVFGSSTEPVSITSESDSIYVSSTIGSGGKAVFNNVTVSSTSGDGINLAPGGSTNGTGAHTFNKVRITAPTGTGLKLTAGSVFDDIVISSKLNAIDSTRTSGFGQTYTNIDLSSSAGYGIYIANGGVNNTGGIVFGNASSPVKISAPLGGGIYIADNISGAVSFNNLTIDCQVYSSSATSPGGCIWLADNVSAPVSIGTSADVVLNNTHASGYAFYTNKASALTVNTLTGTGGGGIYLDSNVTGAINISGTAIKPISLTATGSGLSGIFFRQNSLNNVISYLTINAADGYGLRSGTDNVALKSLSNFSISSKNDGINFNAQNANLVIENGVITVTGNASGISLGSGGSSSSTRKDIRNVTINLPTGAAKGVSIQSGRLGDLSNICTAGGTVGLYTGTNTSGFAIKNNFFTTYSSRGLQLDSSWNNVSTITNNCFNTVTSPMASAAQSNTASVAGNYWQGVTTGKYNPVGSNINDQSALASCPLTSSGCYSTPPTTALVGDWHMDEALWSGSANEVVDSSTSAFHGSSVGGANTGVGQVCSAGKFDGINDHVALPSITTDFSTGGLSMAAWVKGEASGTSRSWERVLDLGVGGLGNSILLARNDTSSSLTFEVYDASGSSCGKTTASSFFDGSFHHVVATIDSGKVVKIYKDGVLAATGSSSCMPAKVSRYSSYVGRSNYSQDAYFKGSIDEAKVWSGALSAAEVTTGYNNEKSGKAWDGSARSCSAVLIAEYHLDETSWNGTAGEVKDSVGSAHGKTIGTVSPTSATPARSGNPGTCGYASMNSPTSNASSIEVSSLPVSTTTGDQTSVSFWMYWDGTDGVMPVGWGYHDLFLYADRFGFNTANSDVYGISGASGKLANGWHHVVAVFTNGDVTKNALYIDGVAQALSQQTGSQNTANAKVQGIMRIGGWTANSSYNFRKWIDEVKVYQGAVNQAQVTVLYNERHACASMIADWRLDESSWSGTTGEVKDTTASAYHGTARGGASTISGKVCKAGQFDGVDDYVSLPSIPADLSGGLSIAAWVKGEANGSGRNYERIVDLANGQSNDNILWMRRAESNDLSFEVYSGSASCGQFYVSNMLDGNWHHYAVTLDPAGGINIYRDGAVVKSGTYSCYPRAVSRTSNYIAKSNWSGDATFKGGIDELKVWNYALTGSEISAGYANENTGKRWDGSDNNCSAVPVLKARMDEAAWSGANAVIDSSGKDHHGTPMNGAKTLKCGSKQVGYFSGSGAYVDFGNHADLSPQASSAQALTLGAWVKADYANLSGTPSLAGGGSQILFNKIAKPGEGYKYEWLFHVGSGGDLLYLDLWQPGGSSYGFLSRSVNIGWTGDTIGTCSGSSYYDNKACWHFIAMTWDSANQKWGTYVLRPDVDDMGNKAATGIREDYQTGSMTQGPPSATASPPTSLWIGTGNYYGDRHFKGMMTGAILAKGAMSRQELRDWADSNWPDPCDNPITAPSLMNAVDTGKSAVTGIIGTKVAGTPFSVDIYALKSDNSGVDTNWSGDLGVDLVDGASCGANSVAIATAPTNATLVAGAKTGFVLPTVTEAYKNVRIRLRYPATGTATKVACSADNFAIRPNMLGLALTDQDWASAGTGRTLTNTGVAASGNVHKAGQPFTLTATGYNSANTITGNYAGSVELNMSTQACSGGAACTTTLGVLSDVASGAASTLTLTATSGTVTTSVKYSEVGAFQLRLEDRKFASVDATDGTPADCSGQWICSTYMDVGRFVPDHFDITALTPAPKFQTFGSSCSGRSFTYMGQTFGFADNPAGGYLLPKATVTARNADGQTTANYKGTLWRLTSLGVMNVCKQAAVGGSSWSDCVASVSISMPSNTIQGLVSNNDGTGTFTWKTSPLLPRGIKYGFQRTTAVAPFAAKIGLGITIYDTSESAGSNQSGANSAIRDTQGTTPTWTDNVAFDAGNEFRFGRLSLKDGYVSSTTPMPMRVTAEYEVGGNNFNTNTADNCTVINAGDMKLASGSLDASKVSLPTASVTLSQGLGTIMLGAPGSANKGFVYLCIDLGNDSSSQRACTGGSSASGGYPQSYLQTGSAFDSDPSAKASFGIGGGAAKRLFYMMQ